MASPAQYDNSRRGDPPTAGSLRTTVDPGSMTWAELAVLPLSTDVALAIAEQHGVCVRPIAMRRIDATTGRTDIIPVSCSSTRDDHCRPCADKARRLRMAQCREGWHMETEPVIQRRKATETQREVMAARADLFAAYAYAKPRAMRSPARKSPIPWPNSTPNSERPGSADG